MHFTKKSKIVERMSAFTEYDRVMETDKWSGLIPPLSFPIDWQIHIVPPSLGAIVRFAVVKQNKNAISSYASIYLDGYDILGIMEKPYWEVFTPNNDNFPQRCLMEESDVLIELISKALEE